MSTWLDRARKKMKSRREKVDPDSMTAKLNFGARHLTLHEQVSMMLRSSEFERAMMRSGYETEDEANDFDVPDEVPVTSPHEYTEMQEDEDMRTLSQGDPRSRPRRKASKDRGGKRGVEDPPHEDDESDVPPAPKTKKQ